MKRAFLAFERFTGTASMVVAGAMLSVAACLGMFQVVTRFVLEQPAEWTEVLIRMALIWMVFLGIPSAFRAGSMVSVDLLHRSLPRAPRRVLDGVIAVAGLVLLAVIIVVGYDYMLRGRVQTVIGLEGISMSWAYAAIPVGGVFAVIGVVAHWIDPRHLELETAQ